MPLHLSKYPLIVFNSLILHKTDIYMSCQRQRYWQNPKNSRKKKTFFSCNNPELQPTKPIIFETKKSSN